MVDCCEVFIGVESAITTDMLSIHETLDQNDVDNWKAGLERWMDQETN